ncbi:MAG: hypothetical protein AB7K67_15080 [Hyphomicrobiaceae bacterium]
MIGEQNAAEVSRPIPSSARPPWMTNRRIVLLAGAATLGAGLALNWGWLTAAGVAPILLSLAPCAAMCALGLCMRGGGTKSCSTHGKAGVEPLSHSRQE